LTENGERKSVFEECEMFNMNTEVRMFGGPRKGGRKGGPTPKPGGSKSSGGAKGGGGKK